MDAKHIHRLYIRNFMVLDKLDVRPGKVNVITGSNGVGKTTVLKAIAEALGGGGKHPNLIRLGEERAEVMLDLGELQVDRRITPGTNKLEVTHDLVGGGTATVQQPQSYLDALVGPLSFNPVGFFEASPRERRDMLLSIIPCEVTMDQLAEWFGDRMAMLVDCHKHGLEVLADAEKILVEQRRGANADLKVLSSRVADLKARIPEDFDEATWRAADASALSETIRAAGQAQAEKSAQHQKIGETAHRIEMAVGRLAETKREIERLQAEMSATEDAIAADERLREHQTRLLADMKVPDVAAAQQQLAAFSEAQGTLKLVDELKSATKDNEAAELQAYYLDASVTFARQKPAELLAASTLPIEGLEITADAIRMNGVLIEDLSTSEQLRFALSVARALAGEKLPIILIDGVECLDQEHFETLCEEMQADDFQYFVTAVSGEASEGLQIHNLDGVAGADETSQTTTVAADEDWTTVEESEG